MGAQAGIVAGVDASPEGSTVAALAAAEADMRGVELLLVRPRDGDDAGRVAHELIKLSHDAVLVAVTRALAGGRDPVLDRWLPDLVLTHARCPVLVSAPGHHRSQEHRAPVLVGVDGTDYGIPAARLAFEAAALRHAPLRAIAAHCAHSADAAQEALATVITPLSGEFPTVPVSAEPTYAPDIAAALVDATAGAGLIVVGSRGRGPITSLVLGPVSQALVERARCPVLITHAGLHPASSRPR
jgi:nucleotide-binding universal stress UspA family protein